MSAKLNIKRVIVSRTDAIGDVILTLPVCGIIKKYYPDVEVLFLGRTYTQPVINCCSHVDGFVNADELFKKNKKDAIDQLKELNADVIIHVFPKREIAQLAKQAGIKMRIGTTNRVFHWGRVNKLVRLSRKNSPLHESQLNCKLLEPLGIFEAPALVELSNFTGFNKIPALDSTISSWLDPGKRNIILHPKSNASAREWSLENFENLISLLSPEKFNIFISGTNKEKKLLDEWLKTLPSHVTDISGQLTLEQFISFISKADHLIAASTGPLHIAAAAGIGATGLYPPIRPMHPGRWQPIGKKAGYLCVERSCNDCRRDPKGCHCMNEISPSQVAEVIISGQK